ncbi:MAG: nicotinamide mononucleotide transporter [Oscillospiraceae bacterium]|nr:nicotinamide mononucleotide transporter [Oscillospiraceae bacterium]
MIQRIKTYFTKSELLLWGVSTVLVLGAFLLFDRENVLTLCASLIGVTYLILNAKGNPAGQVLVILFSLLYGILSFRFAYYGEMVTYLGMTMPMAVVALIAWLKHPFQDNKAEVRVNTIHKAETLGLFALAAIVTAGFYFILKAFHTANLIPSTLSVTTSFIAVYLTFRRSPFYAIAYSANDIVLIVLWVMASMKDTRYISVVVCFAVFLINDIYSFFSWQRMQERQTACPANDSGRHAV